MNKKILKAALAGTAVVALAAGGGTWSAYTDYGSVDGNSVGAGILKLNLSDGDGGAVTPISFGNLYPGGDASRAVWVASSDGASVPDADLYMTLNGLDDQENGCSTNASEQAADPNCGVTGNAGELSKILNMRIQSYAAPSATQCKGYVGGTTGDPGPMINNAVIPSTLGNLVPAMGQKIKISDPLNPVEPGQGICVVFTSYWPGDHVGGTPDNAAQGDSLTFNAKFDLEQHF